MKKGLVSFAAFFLALAPVKANGIATINVEGKTNATVGETINVNLKLENIQDTIDGVVAIGGDLKYDKEYLEYVGSLDINPNYKTEINEKILRIAGLDFTLENGIKEDSAIYTFSFKVLKEGNTSITFENPEVVDTDASAIASNVLPLNITINSNNQEEVKTPEIKAVEKEEKLKADKEDKKTNNVIEEKQENEAVIEETKEENTEVEVQDNEKSFVEKITDMLVGFFNVILNIFK
jgi:hypothetical protein